MADELQSLEDIERQVRVRYRGYVVAVALVSLVVGGLVGFYTPRDRVHDAALTPPPHWGAVCAAASVAADVTPAPTVTPQPLRVYVSGAVVEPRVVEVPAGSLLADALEAVGGATGDADLEGLNLAAPLSDHQHVIVPRRPAAPEVAQGQLDLNTASAVELEALPHIGPTLAQRIVDYREAHGPFGRPEDVQQVAGIGESRYQDIAPYITVNP